MTEVNPVARGLLPIVKVDTALTGDEHRIAGDGQVAHRDRQDRREDAGGKEGDPGQNRAPRHLVSPCAPRRPCREEWGRQQNIRPRDGRHAAEQASSNEPAPPRGSLSPPQQAKQGRQRQRDENRLQQKLAIEEDEARPCHGRHPSDDGHRAREGLQADPVNQDDAHGSPKRLEQAGDEVVVAENPVAKAKQIIIERRAKVCPSDRRQPLGHAAREQIVIELIELWRDEVRPRGHLKQVDKPQGHRANE